MHIPEKFAVSDAEEIFAFLEANAFGQLISMHDAKLTVSHLPFMLSADRGRLLCHLARQNPQWQQIENQQVLVTFQGPHDYISPSWYQSAGVPTWNYQAVHVYGRCRAFHGADELGKLVESLASRHEARFESPWQPRYPDSMLKGIVGIELVIEEIQCKYKLSQNRPADDHQGVIDRLDELGSNTLAAEMRKTLL